MEKQLNFLNIFDEKDQKKIRKDDAEENEGIDVNNVREEKKDILEIDPIEFDKFEVQQKEAADRLVRENKEASHQNDLDDFLVNIKDRRHSLQLSDFEPFLEDLSRYHERFESFKKQYNEVKPGLDKERVYKKIISPNTEDASEFKNIATLYLIYLEKLEASKLKNQKQIPDTVNKRRRFSKRKDYPELDKGKDAAAGAYLDYRE